MKLHILDPITVCDIVHRMSGRANLKGRAEGENG